jgi:hypothetical protein
MLALLPPYADCKSYADWALSDLVKKPIYLDIVTEALHSENKKLLELHDLGFFDFLKPSLQKRIRFDDWDRMIPEHKIQDKYKNIIQNINNFCDLDNSLSSNISQLNYCFEICNLVLYSKFPDRTKLSDFEFNRDLRRYYGNGYYDFSTHNISSTFVIEEDFPTIISHEYTHYLQDVLWLDCFNNPKSWYIDSDRQISKRSAFIEGHALGMESLISNLYSSKNNSEAFLFKNINYHVYLLRDAYIYLSDYHNKYISRKLTNVQTLYDSEDVVECLNTNKRYIRNVPSRLSPYSVGAAFFAELETRLGPDIYVKMLKEKISFL